MNNPDNPRHPQVILGAPIEHADKALSVDGTRYDYRRVRELLDELEHSLLIQAYEASVKSLRGER